MQILPIIPTDNFYKFLAISGTWLSLGLVAFYMYLGYLNHLVEIESIESSSYFKSLNINREIDLRLKSINNNEHDKNKIEWMPNFENSDDEVIALKEIKSRHEKSIKKHEAKKEGSTHDLFVIAKKIGFIWIMPFYVFISLLSFWYGYKYWIIKVQIPSDKSLALDVQIKELTLAEMKQKSSNTQIKLSTSSYRSRKNSLLFM